MADDLKEISSKTNADKEFIFRQFAEILRDLIRAVAVRDDPSPAVHRAAGQWNVLAELFSRCKEPISAYDMFLAGVTTMRNAEDEQDRDDEVDLSILIAARLGMSLYIESTCVDNAA